MAHYPIINGRKVIEIYKGDSNNKPVKVLQVLTNRGGAITELFSSACIHNYNISYEWTWNHSECTGTATCALCGDVITETVYPEEVWTHGSIYSHKATFSNEIFDEATCSTTHQWSGGHTHSYTTTTTAPTCTTQGYTTYTCSCGDSYTDNYVAVNPSNHAPANGVCTRCGANVGAGGGGSSGGEVDQPDT